MLAAGFLSQWVVGEVGYCSTRHQGRVCLGGITITNTKRVILEDIFHYSVNVIWKTQIESVIVKTAVYV